ARQLREIGYDRLIVVIGHEEGSVRAALRPFGEEGLLFVRQPGGVTPGTATATVAALEAAGATAADSSALVVYGDVIVSTEDLRRVRELQEENHLPAVAL